MKSFYLLLTISLLFSACDDWPGEVNTTSDEEVSANLDNGGTGSESNPYAIGSGIFTILDDDDYYDFEVEDSNDDCSLILYDVDSNYGSYTITTDDGTYSSNMSAEVYSTYNYISNGTFVITNSSDEDSMFGVYSTCVDSTYDYSLREFSTSDNSYDVDDDYELFTFELSSESSVTFTYSGSGSYSSYYRLLFDENFDRLYSFDDLEEGTYYVLLEGSSTYTPTITFSID